MHISKLAKIKRRAFLQRTGQLGLMGVAAPWAVNLAAMGEAAAYTATDYKAIVCVFLNGGNDHNNTIVPFDTTNYARYANLRGSIALPQASLLPLNPSTPLPGGMQLALPPALAPLAPLFDAGRLAVQLNVGPLFEPTTRTQYLQNSVLLPPKLYSHNDQASIWQSSMPEGAASGWGGRMADLVLSANADAAFSCISLSGNSVYLAGRTAVGYQCTSNGPVPLEAKVAGNAFGSAAALQAMLSLVSPGSLGSNSAENEYAQITRRGIQSEASLSSAFASSNVGTAFPATSLGSQLKAVAKLIGARNGLGLKRQVFMVSLGGFDTHDKLILDHTAALTVVGQALAAFQTALAELNVEANVTTFTASEFGRTLSSNGDGTDHGWGSHHLLMGGAVRGRQFYGTAPEIGLNTATDANRGSLIPTTSVDQLAATLATWFGISATDLPIIAPHLPRFSQKNLGYFA